MHIHSVIFGWIQFCRSVDVRLQHGSQPGPPSITNSGVLQTRVYLVSDAIQQISHPLSSYIRNGHIGSSARRQTHRSRPFGGIILKMTDLLIGCWLRFHTIEIQRSLQHLFKHQCTRPSSESNSRIRYMTTGKTTWKLTKRTLVAVNVCSICYHIGIDSSKVSIWLQSPSACLI